MGDRLQRSVPVWLTAVAAVVLAAAAAVAVIGSTASAEASDGRSAAQSDADRIEALVEDAELVLADLRAGVEVEQAALGEAEIELDEAESDRDTLKAEVADSRQEYRQTEAEIPIRRAEASAYVAAMTSLVDLTSTHVEAQQALLDLRMEQVSKALDGDVSKFNRLQGDFNKLAEQASLELDEIDGMVSALPGLTNARRIDGPGSGRLPTTDAVLEPPTGRARIAVASSDVIPCTPYGTDGCRYNWKVTFTETNWLGVTIERIAVRYDERGGRAYWFSESGEWRDVSITVPAGGTATYDSWVRTDDKADSRLIIGGKLKLRYRGTDADGNAISGSLTVPLERP
jgi:hypothetical protein